MGRAEGEEMKPKSFEIIVELTPQSTKTSITYETHPKGSLIRCKDCKHQVKEWRTDNRLKDKGYMVCGCDVVGDACGYWALLGQDEDFCSMAEPKESDK